MDERIEAVDPCLRPTTVMLAEGRAWTKTSLLALLAKRTATVALGEAEQRTEKQRVFDLLDALTKSGALPLGHAELHVVLCATHAFAASVVDTVVQGNVNPVERAERAAVALAALAHGAPAAELLEQAGRARLAASSPLLFDAA